MIIQRGLSKIQINERIAISQWTNANPYVFTYDSHWVIHKKNTQKNQVIGSGVLIVAVWVSSIGARRAIFRATRRCSFPLSNEMLATQAFSALIQTQIINKLNICDFG